jgi:hypothetical protein
LRRKEASNTTYPKMGGAFENTGVFSDKSDAATENKIVVVVDHAAGPVFSLAMYVRESK